MKKYLIVSFCILATTMLYGLESKSQGATYTAGDNVTIVNNVISASTGSALGYNAVHSTGDVMTGNLTLPNLEVTNFLTAYYVNVVSGVLDLNYYQYCSLSLRSERKNSSDLLGAVYFAGHSSNDSDVDYSYIQGSISTPTAGVEIGKMDFINKVNGVDTSVMTMTGSNVAINGTVNAYYLNVATTSTDASVNILRTSDNNFIKMTNNVGSGYLYSNTNELFGVHSQANAYPFYIKQTALTDALVVNGSGVSIGKNNGTYKLDVADTANFDKGIIVSTLTATSISVPVTSGSYNIGTSRIAALNGTLYMGDIDGVASPNVLIRGAGGSDTMSLVGSNVGISSATPMGLLTVGAGSGFLNVMGTGQIFAPSLGSAGTGTALVISATNEIIPLTSSIRFKENVTAMKADSSKLMLLKPVEFDYKKHGGHAIGFIAEDVIKVFPSVVNLDKEKKPYSISYEQFIPLLVDKIQKQQAIIDNLESRIFKIEKKK